MRLRVLAVVVALGSSWLWASPAQAAAAARPYDFNGDGYPELVVGAPKLQVGPVFGAGGVVVLPASARGLSLTERIISQSSAGVPGASEGDDRFGSALASADFDRDGYADLAVGQPWEIVGEPWETGGGVTVVYGSSDGLVTSRSRRLPLSDSFSGAALVAGDFNGDGFPDLAVGAPHANGQSVGDEDDHLLMSGTVTVLSGGSSGLSTADPLVLHRQEGRDFDSRFGTDLAAGDLDGDGGPDLIIYSEGQDDTHTEHPGSISYCLGRVGGLAGCTHLGHHLDYHGAESLAVGNISGDSRPEIVIGMPYDEHGGAVLLLQLGARTPLTVARQETLTQRSPGVPGSAEVGDRFGSSIALGDIDRDGYADLVIGASGENNDKGRVTVVHGAAAGWRVRDNYSYHQDSRGIPGVAEAATNEGAGDRFGSDVSLDDHNRDGRLDLTIGAFTENNNSGAITTLRGSGRGFSTTGARTFGLPKLGYPHPAGAEFGNLPSAKQPYY